MLATLAIAYLALNAMAYGSDIWSSFPGEMVEISAKGERLWALNKGRAVFAWQGSDWIQNPFGGYLKIAACVDESAWGLMYLPGPVERLNVSTKLFVSTGLKDAVQINAIYQHSAVAVTNDGKVHLFVSNGWTAIGQDAKWAAIGEGDERWMISKNGSIYRWENHKWEVKPGPEAETIDVQNEHRVVITGKDHKVYTWQDPDWELIDGFLAKSATINETDVFAVAVNVGRSKFKTCQASMNVQQDTHFLGCSAAMKSSDGMTEEKCCKKCKKVPSGGGCYYHDKECNVCNGEVKDEQPMKGSVMFKRPVNEH